MGRGSWVKGSLGGVASKHTQDDERIVAGPVLKLRSK